MTTSARARDVLAPQQLFTLPAQLPKPHQLIAEVFCRRYQRVILADDMGVGKTLPAIRASVGRTIVVFPSSTKQSWRHEILRERPHARVLILSGTKPSLIEADGGSETVRISV